MSHRALAQSFIGLHVSWNGETVLVNTDTATGDDPAAVVSLNEPLSEYDRGKGILNRAKLMFRESQDIPKNSFLMIRGERWMVDYSRKPEDGGRIWYAVRYEKQFTSPRSGNLGGGS